MTLIYSFHIVEGKYPEGAPFLPLQIINPNNGLRMNEWGLIDTGAKTTYIPRSVADNLGHKLEKGQRAQGPTAGGQAQVYLHTFEINIIGMDDQGNVDYGDIRIKISMQLIPVGENVPVILLGVKELLNRCVLGIDYPHQTLSIEIQEGN